MILLVCSGLVPHFLFTLICSFSLALWHPDFIVDMFLEGFSAFGIVNSFVGRLFPRRLC